MTNENVLKRVRITKGRLNGKLGNVIGGTKDLIEVELDNFSEYGHDLMGNTAYGYGYSLDEGQYEIVSSDEHEEDVDSCNDKANCSACQYKDDCTVVG